MAEMRPVLTFKQCVNILKSTGKKATDLRELGEMIAEVSGDSIFHHTYQYLLKEHIHEYTNNFAHWAGKGLGGMMRCHRFCDGGLIFSVFSQSSVRLLLFAIGAPGSSPRMREETLS